MKKFIISLYCDDCNCFSIDLTRYEIFKYRQNMDIRSLPPTRDALVSGHIWGRENLTNKTESHHQIGLGVLAVIKFCAVGFHLITHLFQKISRRQLLKNVVVDWNARRTVAAKKKTFHIFPYVNAEKTVTCYDWKLIHYFMLLYVFMNYYLFTLN